MTRKSHNPEKRCDHLTHISFSTPHPDVNGMASFMWCPQCGALGVPARCADIGVFVPGYFTRRETQEFQVGKEKYKDYWFYPGYKREFHPSVAEE